MENDNEALIIGVGSNKQINLSSREATLSGEQSQQHWDSLKSKFADFAVTETEQEKIRTKIIASSALSVEYVMMNAFATIVGCCGLVTSSTPVVIGAMIMAMLLGPIVGVSLALVEGDNNLLKKALMSEAVGVMIVLCISFMFANLYQASDTLLLNSDLIKYTSPNILDLIIAMVGGAAGTFVSISRKLRVNMIGVAMAITLMPPLSACGIFLSHGHFGYASGAFLLFFANFVGIQFSSSMMLWLFGFNHVFDNEGKKINSFKRNALSTVLIVLLSFILGYNLKQTLGKQQYEHDVRMQLNTELSRYPGAYLNELQFQGSSDEIITAVVRTKTDLTNEQVSTLDDHLPLHRGKKAILHVQTIKMTELTTNDKPVIKS